MAKKNITEQKRIVQFRLEAEIIDSLDAQTVARGMTRSSLLRHITKLWLAEQIANTDSTKGYTH